MRILSVLTCLALLASCHPPEEYSVVVEAGSSDRINTPVSFEWPDAWEYTSASLLTEEDSFLPVQRHGDKAWFILPNLAKGESQSFKLVPVYADFEALPISATDVSVTYGSEEQRILRYNFTPTDLPREGIPEIYRRGGYIHPVLTPGGTLVTDDYPENHVHHHGIWAAWTNTIFEGRTPDFWNMGQETGTVVPVALDTAWTGQVLGGLTSRHQYHDLLTGEARPAIDETWQLSVFHLPGSGYHLFDLQVNHVTATDSILSLPEYRYGGIGFRGHGDWNGEEHTFFLTSEGRNRSDGHATTARWCHIGGYTGGQLAGIGILSHPDNFRAPQPMRIHPTEPFFNWAPSQAGDWAITPDHPFEARYRFVVSDGPADTGLLERLWNDFAAPPRVTFMP